ncbi:MAG: hypothetical protein U5R31_15575 [Acidimicrobiia bacterium]|nr:hypothetical protein [Acidimicrobiia bacterium]
MTFYELLGFWIERENDDYWSLRNGPVTIGVGPAGSSRRTITSPARWPRVLFPVSAPKLALELASPGSGR